MIDADKIADKMTDAVLQSPVGARLVIGGRRFSNFAGSSYLGLSGQADILRAGSEALARYGAGASLLRGQGYVAPPLLDAEAAAAAYFDRAGTLFLPNGYLFGLTLLQGLCKRYDVVFHDECAHVSLIAGIRAAGVVAHPFRHLDPEDLRRQLRSVGGRPLVVTDGLYALHGDIAPLAEYAKLTQAAGGHLLVDESHGFGVLGATGRGACEHHLLAFDNHSLGGSLAKAFGVAAGMIVTDPLTVELSRQASSHVGASQGLPAAAAMAAASLRHVAGHPELLERLRGNALHAKRRLRGIGLDIPVNDIPIIAFSVGNGRSMQDIHWRLREEGLLVYLTDYGKKGEAIFRLGIFADHAIEQIDALADTLGRLL